MNLRATLAAALEVLGDVPANSIGISAGSIQVCILDAPTRRTIADELGADAGTLGTGGFRAPRMVTQFSTLTVDDGEIEVRLFGYADDTDLAALPPARRAS